MRVIYFLFLVVFLGAVGLFAYQNANHEVTVQFANQSWTVSLPVVVAIAFALGMFGGWSIVGMLKRSWRGVTAQPAPAR
jgi:hypothetical protein